MGLSVQAVLFDAGGTLLHVRPSVGRIYGDAAARFGVPVDFSLLERTFREHWRRSLQEDGPPLSTSEEEERAWWKAFVQAVFAAAGHRDAFGEKFDAYFADLYERFASPEVWELYEDVTPALDALEGLGVRCAVVSNWDSRLPLLLDRMEIGSRFEFVLTSAQAGWRKPDPRIFELALGRLKLPPAQVIYVGDTYDEDVVGAARAGLTAFHLQRHEPRSPSASAITTLRDIPEAIRRMVAESQSGGRPA